VAWVPDALSGDHQRAGQGRLKEGLPTGGHSARGWSGANFLTKAIESTAPFDGGADQIATCLTP